MYHLRRDMNHGPIPDRFIGRELWKPYDCKYKMPSKSELDLILPFLRKFALEYPEFVEDDNDPHWVLLKNHIRSSNPRKVLLRFLHQVRQSKGYDVDLCLDFLDFPCVFFPRSLDDKKFFNLAKATTDHVIGDINARMEHMSQSGKVYKFVSVDKLVSTANRILLLTFTVKRADTDAKGDAKANAIFHEIALDAQKLSVHTNGFVETFQAMVHAQGADDIAEPPFSFQVKYWRFKW